MSTTFSFTVDSETEPLRLDAFLSQQESLGSRSQIKQRLLHVRVNGVDAKLSAIIRTGDHINGALQTPASSDLNAEPMNAEILFENDDAIVVNKPAGLVVHPALGNYTGTLLNGLLGHVQNLQEKFGTEAQRPGIVHRLDKDTSGVLIAAKHPSAHDFLSHQFAERHVGKLYVAVVKGIPRTLSGVVSSRIVRDPANRKRYITTDSATKGKPCRTSYQVLHRLTGSEKPLSVVLLYPHTGRTHQLRVHMQSIGCPILGDPVYSRKESGWPDSGLLLHAALLSIALPGESVPSVFFAAIPCRWNPVLELFSERDPRLQDHVVPADKDWFESRLQLLRAVHEQETPSY